MEEKDEKTLGKRKRKKKKKIKKQAYDVYSDGVVTRITARKKKPIKKSFTKKSSGYSGNKALDYPSKKRF